MQVFQHEFKNNTLKNQNSIHKHYLGGVLLRFFLTTGIILTVLLCMTAIACADENTLGKTWTGTWTDANFSLSLEQNGTEITGIGQSFDFNLNDPFILSGSISEDGTSLNGVMKDTGTLEMYLSDDQMSFTGNGTVDQVLETGDVYSYSTEGTRNGTIIPDKIWSGDWLTGNSSIIINQEGNTITGEYFPLTSPETSGVFEGTVSEDGKTLSMAWSFIEKITFIQSDDGMYLIEADCGEKEIASGEICLNLTRQQ